MGIDLRMQTQVRFYNKPADCGGDRKLSYKYTEISRFETFLFEDYKSCINYNQSPRSSLTLKHKLANRVSHLKRIYFRQ
jgi:hypothetical protein